MSDGCTTQAKGGPAPVRLLLRVDVRAALGGVARVGGRATTRFHEVEVSEKLGVWFVDVIGDTERAFRCGDCGDTFDLSDRSPETSAPTTAPAATKTGMERVEEMAAEQRRRDAAGKAKAAEISTRIDDELAELKKRMGK